MARGRQPLTVVNLDKYGRVFDPSGHHVDETTCPALYQILRKKKEKTTNGQKANEPASAAL